MVIIININHYAQKNFMHNILDIKCWL